ncbi:Cobalt-precorrin-4 C(11)-methyltransferase [Candidatus Hodgkinia cicadicola]|nr:Cobalt-precorrin-4 C(11)-methyltransferase [Candidatus Hodgkinia cicadicola]
MFVWLIGITSGQLDLLSLKALTIISSCKFCFYAGSLININLLRLCSNAICVRSILRDSIEDIIYMFLCSKGLVVKLYSGSPFFYSGINETSFYLNMLNIKYSILPGVSVIDTAFSYLGYEFTSVWSRSVIITKLNKKSVTNSKLFSLESICSFKPIIVLYLSVRLIPYFCKVATYNYSLDCPVVCIFKSSWGSEIFMLSSLRWLQQDIVCSRSVRMILLIVGKALLSCRCFSNKLTY